MSGAGTQTIALLGAGLMGAPMAQRLLAARWNLVVWNRSAEKAQPLAAAGAKLAESAASAVAHADIVITMLANADAVDEALFKSNAVEALRSGAVVADMSSIPPEKARDHASRITQRGAQYCDAPVSGGTQGAADGTLAIMVGGEQTTFDRLKPVFDVLGRPTLVGPVGAGQISKLANQAIVAVTIGVVAEALLLAAAGGADPAKVREALLGGFADSTILKQHGQRMLDRNWIPGGKVETHVKDLRAIRALADANDLELPLVEAVSSLFESGLIHGLSALDHSAVLLELERLHPGVRVGQRPDQRPAS